MTEPHLAQPVLATPEKPTWWKNRKFWTVMGVILAIALAAGRFVLREHRAEERSRHSAEKELDSFAVGDCVTMSQGKSGTDLTKTGCEVDPSYTVGLHIDASAECSDGKYTQYSITIKDAAVGKLCLAKNLVVGHCYQQGGPGGSTQLVDCAKAGENAYRVVQRFELDDEKRCPEDTTPSRYSAPPRTYCLALPTG